MRALALALLTGCAPPPGEIEAEARRMVQAGRLGEARALYTALEGEPGVDGLALENNLGALAWGRRRSEEPEAADRAREEELRSLLERGYRRSALHLGQLELARGNGAEALCWLQRAEGLQGQKPELADALSMLGLHEEAAGVYGELAGEDPLDLYNLAAALADAGHEVASLAWEVLARADLHDHELRAFALELVAHELHDPGEAQALYAEADWHRSAIR